MNKNLQLITKLEELEKGGFLKSEEDIKNKTFRFSKISDKLREILINDFNQPDYLVEKSDVIDIYIKNLKVLTSYFYDSDSLEWDIPLFLNKNEINIDIFLKEIKKMGVLEQINDELCKWYKTYKFEDIRNICEYSNEKEDIFYIKNGRLKNIDIYNKVIKCIIRGLKLKIKFEYKDVDFNDVLENSSIEIKSIDIA